MYDIIRDKYRLDAALAFSSRFVQFFPQTEGLNLEAVKAAGNWSMAIFNDDFNSIELVELFHKVAARSGESKLLSINCLNPEMAHHEYTNYLFEVPLSVGGIYNFFREVYPTSLLFTDTTQTYVAMTTLSNYTLLATEKVILEQVLGHSVYQNWQEFRESMSCDELWFEEKDISCA